MKKIYLRCRIILMTFALGLAGVFVMNGSLKESSEITVELPKFQSDSVIFVTPKTRACFWAGGGSHMPETFPQEFIDKLIAECLASEKIIQIKNN